MKTLAFTLLLVCLSVTSHAVSASSNQEIPKLVSETYALQKTVGDMLMEFRQRGIPVDQIKAIETFLKVQGLTRDSELTREKYTDKQVTFGNEKLVFNEDLQIKTGRGRILKFGPEQTADQVFIGTYNALMKQDISAVQLFVPEAQAQALARARDAASAAGWNVLMWGTQAIMVVNAGLIDVVGSAALFAERVKTALANTLHGHVKCGPKGEYIVDGEYKYYDKNAVYLQIKETSEWVAKHYKDQDPNSFMSRSSSALERRLVADAVAKLKALSTMFTLDRNKDVVISDDFLKKVWAPKQIQKCDPEYNAKIVEGAWTAPGNTTDEKVRYFQSKQYGPKYNYDYDNHGQPIVPARAGGSGGAGRARSNH